MNRTIVVSGGASGIGAALTKKLRDCGDQVIVIDLADADIISDLSTSQGCDVAIEMISTRFPDGIDGFVACAGVGAHVEPKSKIDRINYFGAIRTIQGLRELVAAKQGAIVAVSSNSAHIDGLDETYLAALVAGDEASAKRFIDAQDPFTAGFNAYCGSKRALALWVRRVAPMYARDGIRLNAIAPGMVDTPLNRQAIDDPIFRESMLQNADSIPMGQGQPEMIADAIVFMLSKEARFMAGSVLFVDGAQDAESCPDRF
ncbi:MAG: SDR family oxidoreductase [Halieaceae bacterium]|nr:SDR family oxidoreductase [Halieaceae bacterium]